VLKPLLKKTANLPCHHPTPEIQCQAHKEKAVAV